MTKPVGRGNRAAYFIGGALVTAGMVAAAAQAAPKQGDWSSYGHDESGARNSPLAEITTANVGKLHQLWVYHMKPAGYKMPSFNFPGADQSAMRRFNTGFASSEATPLVIDGVMYLPTPYRTVVALDAATGKEVWSYNLPGNDAASTRGVAYWPGGAGGGARIVFGTRTGKLMALDAKTGQPVAGFGTAGVVDMKTPEVMNGNMRAPLGMSSPPAIYKNLIITGSRVQEMPVKGAAGDVRAWDAVTGKLVWTFHSIAQPGEPGHDTWEGDSWKQRSGTNVWTFVTVDEKRGIAYLPFGAPTFDRWGADRHGNNLYSNAIVAVDAATGKYLWNFQTVHHDIWDLDLPTATLIDVKRGGKTIPAIALMNKTAILFILDRVTGKPIYDVKEVPVPTDTDIPGEQPSPTQPMPVKPAPLAKLAWEAGDLADADPAMKARCQKMVDDLHIVSSKVFQPLRADSSVNFFPSSLGGSDWGGAAFDPASGYYIVNTNDIASPQQMAQQPDGSWGMKGGYQYFRDPETGAPCQKGPWGEIAAVNVNTGDIAWRHPFGDSPVKAAGDVGTISAGGPITTAGGLTFIGATIDQMFRAFDTRSGQLLWKVQLPASNYGTPMTYRSKAGHQVVAVVATGGFASEPATSDSVVAYGL